MGRSPCDHAESIPVLDCPVLASRLIFHGRHDEATLRKWHSPELFNIEMTLIQSDDQILILVTSLQKTPERARKVATGINMMISLGKQVSKDPDARTLLDRALANADGNRSILNFSIPKPIAREMLTRRLREILAKKAP